MAESRGDSAPRGYNGCGLGPYQALAAAKVSAVSFDLEAGPPPDRGGGGDGGDGGDGGAAGVAEAEAWTPLLAAAPAYVGLLVLFLHPTRSSPSLSLSFSSFPSPPVPPSILSLLSVIFCIPRPSLSLSLLSCARNIRGQDAVAYWYPPPFGEYIRLQARLRLLRILRRELYTRQSLGTIPAASRPCARRTTLACVRSSCALLCFGPPSIECGRRRG